MRTASTTNKIDQDKLKDLLAKSDEAAKEAKNKAPILFMGSTGEGKSTTINFLCGYEMTAKPINFSEFQLNVKNEQDAIAKIGTNKFQSETSVPQIIECKKEEENEEGPLYFCDCPGFFDTRGREYELCATSGAQRVIREAKSIRGVVAVISWKTLEDGKGEKFRNFIATCAGLLKSSSELNHEEKNAITFIITKVPVSNHSNAKKIVLDQITEYRDHLTKDLNDNNQKDEEELTTKLDVLSLIIPERVFMICQDGSGYAPNSDNALNLAKNRAAILEHLTKLPANSIAKKSFVLLGDGSKFAREWKSEQAKLELFKLARTAVENQLLTDNTDSEQMRNISNSLHTLNTAIRTSAQSYWDSFEGTKVVVNDELERAHQKVIEDMALPRPFVKPDVVKQLAHIIERLTNLQQSVENCFQQNDRRAMEKFSNMRTQLLTIHAAIRQQISLPIITALQNYQQQQLQPALNNTQTRYVETERLLAERERNRTELLAGHANRTQDLTQAVQAAEAAATTLTNSGRPAVTSDPGEEKPSPGNAPAPFTEAEPSMIQHPGNPPIPNPLIGGANWFIWQATLNKFHELEEAHGKWQTRKNAAQENHNQWQTASNARTAWITAQQAYMNSLNAAQTYDNNLTAAGNQVNAARNELNAHQALVERATGEQNGLVTAASEQLKSLAQLRLFLLGAQQSMAQLLLNPQRANAINLSKAIVEKIASYNNAVLAPEVVNKLRDISEQLQAEEVQDASLQPIQSFIMDDQHFTFAKDKSLTRQVPLTKTRFQFVRLNDFNFKEEAIDFTAFRLELKKQQNLIALDLHNVHADQAILAKLLLAFTQLPQLTCLNLSGNHLDDAAGIALLHWVYSHPSIVSINLNDNPLSPIVKNMINLVLVLKQQWDAKKDGPISKEYLDREIDKFLHAQELLSLSATETEQRKFNVQIMQNNNLAATLQAGELRYGRYKSDLEALRVQQVPASDEEKSSDNNTTPTSAFTTGSNFFPLPGETVASGPARPASVPNPG